MYRHRSLVCAVFVSVIYRSLIMTKGHSFVHPLHQRTAHSRALSALRSRIPVSFYPPVWLWSIVATRRADALRFDQCFWLPTYFQSLRNFHKAMLISGLSLNAAMRCIVPQSVRTRAASSISQQKGKPGSKSRFPAADQGLTLDHVRYTIGLVDKREDRMY